MNRPKRLIVAVLWLAAAAVLFVALDACGGRSSSASPSSAPPSSASTAGRVRSSAGDSGPVVAAGHGWTDASGIEGPMPAAGTCHVRWTDAHEPLPDPSCTPGAIDTAVTQANLPQTVCRSGGYTTSVRPPAGITDKAKTKIMAAYGIPAEQVGDYELDHLVPLADGGASDIRNLWPEPNIFASAKHSTSAFVHNDKDQTEQDAFSALCAGRATLSAIQTTMSTDWTAGHYTG
ncbi:hypothetical protein RBS60_04615 [Sinomonas sp. ASV486]|uniref:hypothetical protein n=1 Tax=Sinomonas sp. ASV486 TaxID=3051170 RepID=UPI0027DB54AE|nr:hypothetical protein [Sinomonas sp. ASV486]MDQ4489482.1 hypothetical protein [Sinomonas sp. ASV486]